MIKSSTLKQSLNKLKSFNKPCLQCICVQEHISYIYWDCAKLACLKSHSVECKLGILYIMYPTKLIISKTATSHINNFRFPLSHNSRAHYSMFYFLLSKARHETQKSTRSWISDNSVGDACRCQTVNGIDWL